MSVKIFGDSFVVDDKENSWPWFLSKLMNEKVITYGIGGSSLFSAFQRMCKHASSNEIVMLKVTDSGRLYFDETVKTHINSKNTADIIINSDEYNDSEVQRAKAALLYYDYLADSTFDGWVHNSILLDIKKKFPNVIILNEHKDILVEVQARELALLEIDTDFFLDRRVNHISKTNSLYVAECIYNFYKTGDFQFDINQVKKPDEDLSKLIKFL